MEFNFVSDVFLKIAQETKMRQLFSYRKDLELKNIIVDIITHQMESFLPSDTLSS